MADAEEVITHLQIIHTWAEFARERDLKFFTAKHLESIAQWTDDALNLLKEQEAVVRCKDCENWIPGYITDKDDFIPPKCGKYQQMVGHSADDFCSLAEKQEGR